MERWESFLFAAFHRVTVVGYDAEILRIGVMSREQGLETAWNVLTRSATMILRG